MNQDHEEDASQEDQRPAITWQSQIFLKNNPEFIAAINLTCHPMKIIKIVTPVHYGLPNS